MTWYDDLAEWGDPSLRAVGWLERGYEFAQGPVDRHVYERLQELLKRPWEPVAAGGWHECDLCLYEGTHGNRNLFIPGSGFLYVSPELILHYMNAHGYKPPAEFCHAVLACPPMRSVTYFRAILANGGRRLVPPEQG
jgi:hypothetical protein